jgi:hypothetical protein
LTLTSIFCPELCDFLTMHHRAQYHQIGNRARSNGLALEKKNDRKHLVGYSGLHCSVGTSGMWAAKRCLVKEK